MVDSQKGEQNTRHISPLLGKIIVSLLVAFLTVAVTSFYTIIVDYSSIVGKINRNEKDISENKQDIHGVATNLNILSTSFERKSSKCEARTQYTEAKAEDCRRRLIELERHNGSGTR